MHSPESYKNLEKSWSYDTPYDIVRRRDLILQDDAQKVRDIDNYIAYINEDMSSEYTVETKFDNRSERLLRNQKECGTRIYKANDSEQYELTGYVTTVNSFYGNKVILDNESPVIINTEIGIGVSTFEYVKFINLYAPETYTNQRRYRERAFTSVAQKLLAMKNGEKQYLHEWDEPWC